MNNLTFWDVVKAIVVGNFITLAIYSFGVGLTVFMILGIVVIFG